MILPSNEFLEVFKKTEGALSVCESIAILNIATSAPFGFVYPCMELGTYNGKSAMSAISHWHQKEFILVDPMFKDEKYKSVVSSNLWEAVPKANVILDYDFYSVDAIPKYNKYSYVFVDSGDHQELPMKEVKLLEDRMAQGGIIAFHDYLSQFKEVEEAYNYLLSTKKYEPIPINWNEIIDYVRENNLEEGNNSWHHNELQFPCFVGAVKRIMR